MKACITAGLLAAIVAGVTLRTVNLTYTGVRGSDNVYYTNLAEAWSQGDFVFRIADSVPVFRPASLALYAVAIRLLGSNDWSIKALNAALDTLNIGLVFTLAWLLSQRDLRLSLLCAASYAILPGAIFLAREELVHVGSTFMVLACTVLFVLALGATARRGPLLLASGVFCGLAALTHEELVFCAIGFGAYLVLDHGLRLGRASLWPVVRDGLWFSLPVGLAALAILLFVEEGALARESATAGATALERAGAYFARLFRFTWNGMAGGGSVATAYPFLALLGILLARLSVRAARRASFSRDDLRSEHLLLLVIVGYLLPYAYFFPNHLFARAFLPLFALSLVLLPLWYSRELARLASPRTASALVLLFAVGMVPFHYDQFEYYFAGKQRWYAAAMPGDFDPLRGARRLRRHMTSQQMVRELWEKYGDRIDESARLLIASSTMYPYPGRRVFQLDCYFGDDAIYAIDHTEPFDELVRKYDVAVVLVTTYRADTRVEELDEYTAYEYDGRWSRRPLQLGASYGFGPGEYTRARESLYVMETMRRLGAKLAFYSNTTQIYEL